jgi:hypothetical protein
MTFWRRRYGTATSEVVIPPESAAREVQRASTTHAAQGCLRRRPPPGQLRATYNYQVLTNGMYAALMFAPLALAVSLVACSRGSAWTPPPFPASSGWPALLRTALAQQPTPVTATRVGVVQGSSRKGSGPGSPPLARAASRSR